MTQPPPGEDVPRCDGEPPGGAHSSAQAAAAPSCSSDNDDDAARCACSAERRAGSTAASSAAAAAAAASGWPSRMPPFVGETRCPAGLSETRAGAPLVAESIA
eukprot:108552-Prymnesium_polylepis.1